MCILIEYILKHKNQCLGVFHIDLNEFTDGRRLSCILNVSNLYHKIILLLVMMLVRPLSIQR